MTHWKEWAEETLAILDRHPKAGDDNDRAALEHVVETGQEPYHTLKYFMIYTRQRYAGDLPK